MQQTNSGRTDFCVAETNDGFVRITYSQHGMFVNVDKIFFRGFYQTLEITEPSRLALYPEENSIYALLIRDVLTNALELDEKREPHHQFRTGSKMAIQKTLHFIKHANCRPHN